eukprot:8896516-Karenia_brevis.AAC.1
MGEGGEGSKRGRVEQTPVSVRKHKKGREGGSATMRMEMTPGVHGEGHEQPRVDDADEDEDVGLPLAWRIAQMDMEERM